MVPPLRVRLQETPTLLLYHQENTSVNTLEPVAQEYIAEWDAYIEKREGQMVRTREVTCQTVLKYSVDKASQKSAVVFKDTGSWATQWDMYDEYQKLMPQRRVSRSSEGLKRRGTSKVLFYLGEDQHTQMVRSKGKGGKGARAEDFGRRKEKKVAAVEVRGLMRGLGWMERLLSSTKNIQLLHAFTSGRAQVKEGRKVSMSSEKASVEELWQFTSPRAEGRRVNSLTFCRTSPWLVLATYGELGFTGKPSGILGGWNAKKIGQPELWLPLPGAATVVSSCPAAPELCCVALLDGTMLVYKLDNPSNPQLIMDTSASVDKHSSPVWAVEWRDPQIMSTGATRKTLQSQNPLTERPPSFRKIVFNLKPQGPTAEVAYVLVSSSEDGTIKEWIFIKGSILFCTRLLSVRLPLWLSLSIAGGIEEVLGQNEVEEAVKKTLGGRGGGGGGVGGGGSGGVLLPQKVPATSMHFQPGDKSTYLVGTAAGDVLLCKTFERERCCSVYRGHTALVTRVAWRTAGEDVSSIFLSAALDDSIRVWFVDKAVPVCVLKIQETLGGGYVDACWCPWYSNLLAGVHAKGLHLWDISLSSHAPILTCDVPEASSVSFSPHTRNVVVGDHKGQLHVFHLEGLEISASMFLKFSSAISKLAKVGVIPV